MPNQDPIKKVVVDQDWEKVKSDVNSAMTKIKAFLMSTDSGKYVVISTLQIRGRDQFIYAFFQSIKRYKLADLLISWDENTWDIYYTSGLLLDMGLSLSKLCTEKQNAMEAFNNLFGTTRQKNKLINHESAFYKNLPEHVKTNAGVSASTWNVLLTLHYLNIELEKAEKDKITLIEVEAIMNGLIYFWTEGNIKQWLGQFHTAAEVWAAYNFYLEKYCIKKPLIMAKL